MSESRQADCICPLCGTPMFYKDTYLVAGGCDCRFILQDQVKARTELIRAKAAEIYAAIEAAAKQKEGA